MKVLFLLCSESASVDMSRNTLSVFHIVEELSSPNFPLVIPSLFVSALLEKPLNEPEPEGIELRIQYGNQELLVNPLTIQFQDKPRMRALVAIGGLVIGGPGSLVVSITQGGSPLGAWNMAILDVGQPKIQPELPMQPAKPQQGSGGE